MATTDSHVRPEIHSDFNDNLSLTSFHDKGSGVLQKKEARSCFGVIGLPSRFNRASGLILDPKCPVQESPHALLATTLLFPFSEPEFGQCSKMLGYDWLRSNGPI